MSTFCSGRALAIALCVLLAGCVSPEGGPTPFEDGAAPRVTVREEVRWEISQVRVPTQHAAESDNCLLVEDVFPIAGGRLELVWTPASETARELTLEVAEGVSVIAHTSGRSPLVLTVPSAVAGNPDARFWSFAVILDNEGVLVRQPVSLQVDLTFEGETRPEVLQGRCSAT